MCEWMRKVDSLINPLRFVADKVGAPVFDLAARLYLAQAFFKSGILRFKDWMNGNFDNQIFLFSLEHPVPGIPADIAAYAATTGEIVLPILLVLGLFGRFAAAGILIMTAIIEFTYLHSAEHVIWAILAMSIFIKGPGMLSADYWGLKFLRKAD